MAGQSEREVRGVRTHRENLHPRGIQTEAPQSLPACHLSNLSALRLLRSGLARSDLNRILVALGSGL